MGEKNLKKSMKMKLNKIVMKMTRNVLININVLNVNTIVIK